jgi:L-fucose mutarotase
MLKTKLIHPEILNALGSAGHGSKVLIADGNYPFGTGANPSAKRVYLNVAPGLVAVTDMLRLLVGAIPIEAAEVMLPASGDEPPIFAEFRSILPKDITLQPLGRFEFYDAARHRDLALVITTGEQRLYANVLVTIGVVHPSS